MRPAAATRTEYALALYEGVRKHDVAEISWALREGALISDLDGVKFGDELPAVHHALRDEETLEVLLRGGLAPDAPDPEGRTALYVAAEEGLDVEVGLLLQAGADANARCRPEGYTPLMAAAEWVGSGSQQCVALLVAAGADGRARTSHGRGLELPARLRPGMARDRLKSLLAAAGWDARPECAHAAYEVITPGGPGIIESFIAEQFGLQLLSQGTAGGAERWLVYLTPKEHKRLARFVHQQGGGFAAIITKAAGV